MHEIWLDTSTAMNPGARDEQQDAVTSDVSGDGRACSLVLADGCGGHAGGSLASQIAVASAMDALTRFRDDEGLLVGNVSHCLTLAVEAANAAVATEAGTSRDLAEMSSTLLLVVVQNQKLYWASVGDSPLFLLRDGEIRRLNQTHSVAAYLDLLVSVGEVSPEEAKDHPGRHLLTSALGSEKIEHLDCPDVPFVLREGDVVLAASDGLLTLEPDEIERAASPATDEDAGEIAERLIAHVIGAEDDEQDNVAVGVLRAYAAPGLVMFKSRRKLGGAPKAGRRTGLTSLLP